jgi:hypothetical protein
MFGLGFAEIGLFMGKRASIAGVQCLVLRGNRRAMLEGIKSLIALYEHAPLLIFTSRCLPSPNRWPKPLSTTAAGIERTFPQGIALL